MTQAGQRIVSLEEFLISEASDASGVRHEWIDGHVVAMSGATPEHARLVGAVIAELRAALRGACIVRDGPVAIHVPVTRSGLRPDVSVVCGPMTKTVVEKNGRIEGEAITNPCVLVEVLSESTERDDRGWKFRDYRTLPSLDEYVLVSQDARRVEVLPAHDSVAGRGGRVGHLRRPRRHDLRRCGLRRIGRALDEPGGVAMVRAGSVAFATGLRTASMPRSVHE